MSESQLDLSRLALDRTPSASGASSQPRRRRWLSRYVLPATILLGFMALLAAAAGRQLFNQASVTVVPVIVKRADVQQAGTTLFQAAGWVEPRPTAVSVAALAAGVIQDLLVVEGQQVARDEPIARLISIDAEQAVEQAQTTLAIRQGERQRADAEKTAARIRLERPVHLNAQLADAQSLLARVTTELQKLPFLTTAAKANLAFTQSNLKSKQAAESAIPAVVVERAVRDDAAARAELNELKQRGPHLKREVAALQAKVDALTEQLSLLVEERRQLGEATAKVISAEALCDEARLNVRRARLNLDRTTVRAPIAGRILRLTASPGTRVMGLEQTAGQSSSTVAEMYDPARLQVRADVRLEDVPMVTPGAPVEIKTASSGDMIQGRVLQSTSSANIQKNTLEVKVELIDSTPTVSPEMLVTATFLAPATDAVLSQANETERLFVPEQLLQVSDDIASVWIVDAHDQAIRRTVTVGGQAADGLVEIVNGLNATDKLITSGTENLASGASVIISGEDQTIGVAR